MEQKRTSTPTKSGKSTDPVRYVGAAGLPDGTRRISLGSGVITTLLSRGGTAYVYEIWNSQLEVNRAVKLLHPDRLEENKDRFETEVKITAKLHHPNIVEIYVVGNWNGLPYIEMEQVDGITLEQLIAKRGAIAAEVCTAIGVYVLQALHYAHNQRYMIYGREYRGIIHRDLKPGNIMLARDGRIKLMDFGIAKPVKSSSDTSDGVVVGTMQYLSPEQLQGGAVDVRADLYSFGAVLYELLTGTRTFPERNLARLVTDKLSNRFEPLNKFKLSIPPKLKKLVHRCLNYEKGKRPQSAEELLRELESLHRTLTDQSPEQVLRSYVKYAEDTRTVLDTHRIVPRLTTFIQVVAVAALLAGGSFLFWQIRAAIDRDAAGGGRQERPVDAKSGLVAGGSGAEAEWETLAESAAQSPQPGEGRSAPERKGATERRRQPRTPPAQPLVPPRGRATGGSVRGRGPSSAAAQERVSAAPAGRVPEPRKTGNLVEQLFRVHQTADVVDLMEAEASLGHYDNVLELHRLAPAAVAESVKAQIYRLRALRQSGKSAALRTFLTSAHVADAEFYLARAMWLCEKGRVAEARTSYAQAMKTPGRFLSPVILEQRKMLCRAQVATAAYEANPTSAAKKEAMDSWYEIKLRLQTKPNHSMYRKADSEIRRIGTGGG